MTDLKLKIELIPSSSWGSNLRRVLKPKMWEDIRKKVYQKNNFKCSICGEKRKLQAHEIWDFNDKSKIQKLINIIPLCFMCHMVKHIGFASLTAGKVTNERLIKHFMDVNKCDRITYQKHLKKVVADFEDRSHFEWQLDLTKLKDFE
jgi:hypothetical protein